MRFPVLVVGALGLTFGARPATATPVVTFYNDRASFLAAVNAPTVLDFEGLVPDSGTVQLPSPYHVGPVSIVAPGSSLVVAGRSSAGGPFDSAILIPSSTASFAMVMAFDAGSNITAVGGFFLDLVGSHSATFNLIGPGGALDTRTLITGQAGAGHTHTFIGYTVAGDTISGLYTNFSPDVPAWDDFTYGTAIPAPASLSMVLAGIVLMRRRRA